MAEIGVKDARSQGVQDASQGFAIQTVSQQLPESSTFHHPTVSPRQADIISPYTHSRTNTPSHSQQIPDQTAHLLNLLNFNQPTAQSKFSPFSIPQQTQGSGSARTMSTSDLAGSLARKISTASSPVSGLVSPGVRGASLNAIPAVTETPQEALLKLLNRTPSSSKDISAKTQPSTDAMIPDGKPTGVIDKTSSRETTPVRIFGAENEPQSTAFEPPQPNAKGSIFGYVNPFEQLAASSPRNQSLNSKPRPETMPLKSEVLKPNNGPIFTNGNNMKQPMPSALSSSLDRRTHAESFSGVGATKQDTRIVSEALHETVTQANQPATTFLTKSDPESHSSTDPEQPNDKDQDLKELQVPDLQKAVHEAAVQMQEELKNEESRAELEKYIPKPMAKAFEDTINEITQDPVADSWESADAEESQGKEDATTVRVYNLPMRPFVALEVKGSTTSSTTLRQDIVMKIATLKKDFDQVDRTLVTASNNFIVYALPKNGGFRVIRQDDGENKPAFRLGNNQICNLALTASAARKDLEESETVLATGVNGSVYWTSIPIVKDDAFEEEDLNKRGFIFPPLVSTTEDHTSGAQLKTRAKRSSRHPDFFAVGRGKSIHIVWPFLAVTAEYTDQITRIVDSEKYISERCLKITTGKACKDFAFSEDDSVIVSVDKAGKLKFWDIRDLTEHENGVLSGGKHVDVRTPLLSLHVATTIDKSSQTSVQLLDKERSSRKGTAQRYLLVGMQQNHILHLWDLGLQKPVQELSLPHASETDPICSIAYHPRSGIIIIGHPARNSIYLIHLSAPRYYLPAMSQARFLQRIAANDPSLPRPDSTAIMSGIRELSFSSVGQLRSLDINAVNSSVEEIVGNDETIIEIYVMHSKGVTCLNLKRKDLGWDSNGKAVLALNAQDEGIVEVKELRLHVSLAGDTLEDSTVQSDITSSRPISAMSARAVSKAVTGGPATDSPAPTRREISPILRSSTPTKPSSNAPVTGAEKSEKKKKKKRSDENGDVHAQLSAHGTNEFQQKPMSYASIAQKSADIKQPSMSKERIETNEMVHSDNHSLSDTKIAPAVQKESSSVPPLQGTTYADLEPTATDDAALSASFQKFFNQGLDGLYRKFEEDKRVQEAAGAARQDAVLRLVSSTLTDNVEKSLSRIVVTNIEQFVVPAISKVAASSVDRKVSEEVGQQLQSAIPRELKLALPTAIGRAMQDPEILHIISDLVSAKLSAHVEAQFKATLEGTIIPAFRDLAVNSAQKLTTEVEERVGEQMRRAAVQNQDDAMKIDQLLSLTEDLRNTLSVMAGVQSDLQNEILKLQEQVLQQQSAAPKGVGPPDNPRDSEAEEIISMMAMGKEDAGIIRWLQSGDRQAELFDKVFVRCDPRCLRNCNQVVILSVLAALTALLTTITPERLLWLDIALASLDPQNIEIAHLVISIVDVLVDRLQDAYMQISQVSPGDGILSKIHAIVKQAKGLKTMAG